MTPPRPLQAFGGVIGLAAGALASLPGPPTVNARLLEWGVGDRRGDEVRPRGCREPGLQVSVVGAVDNIQQLIGELAARGHRIEHGDNADVVAHAYEQWGDACLERFWGAFALVIWDRRADTLLLARDRVGGRCLYYQVAGELFAFASGLDTLRALVHVPRDVDLQAVDAYLTFRAVPAPLTIYRSVRKLPAARALHVTRGAISVRRYWAIPFEKDRIGVDEAAERLSQLLREVSGRITADRSWGVLLSGGLDSSLLVGLLSEGADRPVRTFTFAFPRKPEEPTSAARVARRFATDHRVFAVQPRVADKLGEIVACYEEPYADVAAVSLHCGLSLLRGTVAVALTGDGGDELFCGRERHVVYGTIGRLGIPEWTLAAVGRLPVPHRRARLLLSGLAAPMVDRHLLWLSGLPPAEKAGLYAPQFAAAIDLDYGRTLLDPLIPAAAHPVDQMLAVDVGLWVPEVLSVKLRAGSTAGDVDVRAPFLTHRFVEFAAGLPPALKIGFMRSKAVLRRLARMRRIPAAMPLMRGTATKVSVPDLLRGELRPMLEEMVLGPEALSRSYFRPAAIRQLVDAHIAGRADHSRYLWPLLMLEQWHRLQPGR